MNQRRASHSSMPPAINGSTSFSGSSQAALTANAITTALANPYGQYSQSYSSHYARAYMQHNGWPMVNAQGYTLSPTYVPSNDSRIGNSSSWSRPPQSLPSCNSSWYQQGDRRCTYQGCTFTGAHKSVETHMMDRHLIYPPGWVHGRKKSDWDADPSLKGKPIPIQGTTIILDTPEVLDAWLAERKRRWPSSTVVEQKKRKREDAIARGQLSVDDPSLLGRKRPKSNENSVNVGQNRNRPWDGGNNGRKPMDGGWRGRGGRGGGTVRHSTTRVSPGTAAPEEPLSVPCEVGSDSSSEGEEEDDSPEIVSSKPSATEAVSPNIDRDGGHEDRHGASTCTLSATTDYRRWPIRTSMPQHRKKPPRYPFASRPSLLRKLLLPEIRITISNLSQAIRFLVDNDFLQGVEVRPGEADERLIQVIGEGRMESPCAEQQ